MMHSSDTTSSHARSTDPESVPSSMNTNSTGEKKKSKLKLDRTKQLLKEKDGENLHQIVQKENIEQPEKENNELEKSINELEKEKNKLEKEKNKLEKENIELKKEIDELKKENNKLKKEIEDPTKKEDPKKEERLTKPKTGNGKKQTNNKTTHKKGMQQALHKLRTSNTNNWTFDPHILGIELFVNRNFACNPLARSLTNPQEHGEMKIFLEIWGNDSNTEGPMSSLVTDRKSTFFSSLTAGPMNIGESLGP